MGLGFSAHEAEVWVLEYNTTSVWEGRFWEPSAANLKFGIQFGPVGTMWAIGPDMEPIRTFLARIWLLEPARAFPGQLEPFE